MAVILTDQQLTFLAKTLSWKFDLGIKDARNFNDSTVYTGDGVDDLDKLINRIQSLAHIRYQLSVDVGTLFSSYVRVTLDDVLALRAKYVSIFGEVNKPTTPWNVVLTPSTKYVAQFLSNGTVFNGEAVALKGANPGLCLPNPPGLKPSGDWQDYGDGHDLIPPPRAPGNVI